MNQNKQKDKETTETLDEEFKEIVGSITRPEDIRFLCEEIKKILNQMPHNTTVH